MRCGSMNRALAHVARDQRGSSATEFALILPLLTLLLFGFYEAGRIYWNYNIVQASARDAARYAARMPIACSSGGVGSFVDTTDQAQIQNLTRTGTLDGSGDPLVAGWTSNASVWRVLPRPMSSANTPPRPCDHRNASQLKPST